MHTAFFNTRLLWLLPVTGLAMAPATVTVNLATRNESGVSGSAVLSTRGDSTVIELTLRGGKPSASLLSHVHFGTCREPGGVVVALAPVMVGPDSSGSSRTSVATAALDDARKAHGSLLIQTHMADMRPAACGELPSP